MTVIDTASAWAPQRWQVREALRAKDMTQAELARRIGVTDKHMSQMLTGTADGKLQHWVAMATALGMEWQLRPLDPNDSIIAWARESLGLEIEPWQAARMRQHLSGF